MGVVAGFVFPEALLQLLILNCQVVYDAPKIVVAVAVGAMVKLESRMGTMQASSVR